MNTGKTHYIKDNDMNGSLRVVLATIATVFVFLAGMAIAKASKAEGMAFVNGKDVAVLQSQYGRIEQDLKEIKLLIKEVKR